jgi:hypothetical protein
LGFGYWALGPIPNHQSPIPNPQSPIPNSALYINNKISICKLSFLSKVIFNLIKIY